MGVEKNSASLVTPVSEYVWHGYRVRSPITAADLERRVETKYHRGGRNMEGAKNPGVVFFNSLNEALNFVRRIGAKHVGDPVGNY